MRRYIKGFSLNVNAITVSSETGPRTFCTFPSVQITGAPECSNFPSAFCGNDYTAAIDLDPPVIKQVEKYMDTVGTWMAHAGFRGIFGMDFVTKDGAVYPVEINPRFQNSTSLYNVLNKRSKSSSGMLFLLHIAEFLQDEDEVMRRYVRRFPGEELMRPVRGCQVILHNRMTRNIVTGKLEAGVYRLKGEKLEFVRSGASLEECRNRSEVMVTCGVPAPDIPLEANAPICKVQMLRSALDPQNKRKLSAEASKIILDVYRRLMLKEQNKINMVKAV